MTPERVEELVQAFHYVRVRDQGDRDSTAANDAFQDVIVEMAVQLADIAQSLRLMVKNSYN